ncbi:MAG: hypothetical protein O7H40_14460 [Gammaproteobacteria bacterium]|nr:hypothetical protein [Gammaproteobacteria bacterium]
MSVRRVTRTLTAIMVVLVVAHVIAMQANFNPSLSLKQSLGFEYWHVAIFDLDEEESFGTWFSTVILLIAAVLLMRQARTLRAEGDPWHRWWMVLGWAFCFLSIDEVVGLHEMMNTMLESMPWTVVGAYVLALVGLCYLPFLWRYRWRTAILFALAGGIYGGGAVGVEHFSGVEVNSLQYNMLTALEEGMEMLGVILLIYAILDFGRAGLRATR